MDMNNSVCMCKCGDGRERGVWGEELKAVSAGWLVGAGTAPSVSPPKKSQ